MRHTLETNCDGLLNAINVSIDSVEKGSTKYDGTKAILCSSKDEEISRILLLPHRTSTSLTIPRGQIVSLLASVIVTSMGYTSTGAISYLI